MRNLLSPGNTYIVALLRLPQPNVLRCQPYNIPLAIDDGCSGATSANVDTNVVIHVRVQLVVRVGGELS